MLCVQCQEIKTVHKLCTKEVCGAVDYLFIVLVELPVITIELCVVVWGERQFHFTFFVGCCIISGFRCGGAEGAEVQDFCPNLRFLY